MRILKEGSIYFGASVLERAIPFLLMPFLTRLLSTQEYGLISIFTTVAAIFSLVIGLGLDGFIRVIYHKSGNRDFQKYVKNALVISIATLLIAISLIMFFRTHIIRVSGLGSDLLPLIIVVASAQFIISTRLVIFQAMRMPMRYGKVQLSRPISDLLLVVVLVFYLSGGGVERIYAFVASNIITGLIACFSLYREGLFGINFEKKYTLRALRFVTPLLPHSIALTAVFLVDKLILSSSIGLSIVGELAVAAALASPMMIIAESINRFFMPWAYGKFQQSELEQVVGASYLLLICMALVSLMYSILMFFVFEVIVGESFQNALIPAMIMIWTGWLKLAYYVVAKGLMYCESTAPKSLISVVASVVYLGLIVMNIESLDLADVAIFLIVFHFIMLVGTSIMSQIRYPQPWGKLSAVKDVVRILVKYTFQKKYSKRT